ncbi:putative alpha-1-acid glycoprotein 1-like [Scophthalmus maximus]|uniref:Putative alpha-1-acid glycoprotein 1-like n=1 Tax=Scophthalmus maximus TaxID=52904 RepID=A0A2U9BNT7_SCOMX|nr:putative alpha-1-acid glycoprotein 1-like [Scophthalmus maximus]
MFALCVIALFCLLSVSHSAPLTSYQMPPHVETQRIAVGDLTCEDVIRPLDQLDQHQLEGRQVLVAGGLRELAHQERFKSRDSATIHFANDSETSQITLKRVFGFKDSCEYLNSNISLEGSSFLISGSNITMTFLYTSCPDCLTGCLDMLPPVLMDPTKELCPEEVTRGEEGQKA